VPYAGNTEAGTELTLYNTTFQMIEEFVAVYRMHPLLPDALTVGDTSFSLNELSFKNPRTLVPDDTTEQFLRAFGETPALTLSLQNYPRELYDLVTPGGTVNLAEIDIMRDRERGLPRYNDMRRLLLLPPHKSIDDLTSDSQEREALKSVYTDIEQVELMVGSLVDQDRPAGFAFGIIPFHIFLTLASRRILCDRFYMENFNPGLYTEWGFNHVQTETLRTVLVRHFPDLEDEMPENPFLNWSATKGKKKK
jgi:Animal haem peroxidase